MFKILKIFMVNLIKFWIYLNIISLINLLKKKIIYKKNQASQNQKVEINVVEIKYVRSLLFHTIMVHGYG